MFKKILDQQFPRLLTQVCRDQNSPFYGCFDRNWWHYRIRDFASIMLQQGGYFAMQYAEMKAFEKYREALKEIARSSAIFWNERAQKRGAFEEYYPWEKGYPPLAFSSLAIAKLASKEVVFPEDIKPGLKKAAGQLQLRFESQAGNQQVAGLAALAVIKKITPELVNDQKFEDLKVKTLALQNDEGWFTEYDGPDLGYLSVTLDCLWDLYDFTGDQDYVASAQKALDFLHDFIARRYQGAGMHNARNTDYIVPYGITRFFDHKEEIYRKKSRSVFAFVYDGLEDINHFFKAIDDRYWVHYIGHSIARAALLIEKMPSGKMVKSVIAEKEKIYDHSGYVFKSLPKDEKTILVSTKKGGIFSLYDKRTTLLSDYGWVVIKKSRQYVNHWWSDDWNVKYEDNSILVSGHLFPHREKSSTPFMHFGLRIASFFFGSSLTRVLRNVLIFKSKKSDISFHRKLDFAHDSIVVTDTIKNINKTYQVEKAGRASKRHVASADSWNREDFLLSTGHDPTETIVRDKNTITISTIINL